MQGTIRGSEKIITNSVWLIAKWMIQIIGARIDVREGKIFSILIVAEPSRPHLDPPTLTNTHPKDCCWELEMPE